MDKIYTKAGQLLKEARLKAGMEQEHIAEKIGTTASHWSRWETGQHKPGKKYLNKICEALDIDKAQLNRAYREGWYSALVASEPAPSQTSVELSEILNSTATALKSLDLDNSVKIGLLQSLLKKINKTISDLKGVNNDKDMDR